MQLESELDGGATGDEGMASGIQRFETVGFRKWSLSNEAWPAGSWRYSAFYSLPTDGLVAQAKLTESGVELQLPDLPSPLEDPVLGFHRGDPMICNVAADGTLSVDGRLNADGDRWVAGTLISSEQQRRLEVYQQFFRPDDRTQNLDRVLYGWTDLWSDTPQWSRELTSLGSALVSMPVKLQRPAVGSQVFVPHGLVKLRRDLGQASTTFAFSDTTGKWKSELTMAVNAAMQLVLPDEVLPFEAEAIELELDIKAPKRDVTIQVASQAGPVELAQLKSPSIPWSMTITDPQILAEARDGVISFSLGISERTDIGPGVSSSNVVAWQVDSLRASFRGSVAEPSE